MNLNFYIFTLYIQKYLHIYIYKNIDSLNQNFLIFVLNLWLDHSCNIIKHNLKKLYILNYI